MDMYDKISGDVTEKPQVPPPPLAPRHQRLTTFCIGFLMVFSIFSVGREVKDYFYQEPTLSSRSIAKREMGSWGQAIDAMVTPDTVEAISNDPRLRRTLVSVVDYTFDLTDQLVARYESPQLQETREALQEYKEQIRRSLEGLRDGEESSSQLHKRQLPSFGELFGAAVSGGRADSGGGGGGGGLPNPLNLPLPGAPGGSPGGGTGPLGLPGLPTPGGGGADGGGMSAGILSGLLQPLKDGLSNVGNQLVANLNGPGMFLGIGVGAGAAQGLNLSTQAKTMEVAAKVAADNKMEATGLNPAIQNLGVGLTSTLIGAIDFNSLGGNLTNQLQPIALSLATGLGNGTVAGLKLNANAANLEPVNDSSIPNVIGTFGFGLTKTVTANLDINQLFNSANNPNTTKQIMRILPAAASGFGKGLGQGATVGLGLQPDTAVPMQQMPDDQIDFGGISQTFAKGLTSSFLQNGTATELLNKVGGSMNMNQNGGGIPATIKFNGMDIQVSKVAQGFARGFLQGAGDAIQGMGGVQSLFEGNATMPTGAMPDAKLQFDDSLGGAASGFGVGIGGQGVLVAYGLASKPRGNTQPAASVPAAPAASTPAQRRDVELVSRQDPPPVVSVNTTEGFNLSVVINAQTISMAAQAGVNALTCQGVGGLGLIGFGLIRSKTIALDSFNNGNVTKTAKQVIPTGIIKISNEGHSYAIDGQVIRDSLGNSIINAANGIEVNGFKLPGWIAFLVLHILFAIIAYINVLPLAIGLEHMRNLLLRINAPPILPKIEKWNNIMWLFVMGPSVVVVLIFGILVTAKSSHFRTAHGIISLFTTLVGLAAFLMHLAIKARAPPGLPNTSRSGPTPPAPPLSLPIIRVMVNQLFLILSFASVITGFADLSSVALCFTQVVPFDLALVIGFSLSTVFVLGSTVSGLDIALTVRVFLRHRKALKGSDKAIAAASDTERGGVMQGKILQPAMVDEKGAFA
ncbi:hypothetical protein HER10_EVM0010179 [Colletotrichum scovillei]|uniref:Cytochrome b b6 petb-like protein n=1 Tax=Colletotrichum scovillei TaxID=1209932 RepID=A0A9P7ULS4_9PEZI|nr:uncharacterized protein HER10_EVM0010179 [Colletotrichum scovillei]KAF4780206.1 hypothetical protein HER10_EVM0010179 [Colletotrichum scovillei]KAG7057146.1 cytochrome b b6 petb-like protein [Colletotrichum scovillei]KAG7075746.1 cytochrome b b6 petb-like protein [Colletotrichum scovillei]KAG7082868.1 cytochrome b b6 petb-like protein [Colletotrichum scovillei]